MAQHAPHRNTTQSPRASASADEWRAAKAKTLELLDIRAAYEAMGVRFLERSESGGRLACYAIDRQSEKTPGSAGVTMSGQFRGYYSDFGHDRLNLSIFDFAVKFGGLGLADYPAALRHFAAQVGVLLPIGDYRSKQPLRPKDLPKPPSVSKDRPRRCEDIGPTLLAYHRRSAESGELDDLAARLRVHREGLDAIGASVTRPGDDREYTLDTDGHCSLYPESRVTGFPRPTIVSADRRGEGKVKKCLNGRVRGIYIPLGWTQRVRATGYLFVAEGASDIAALTSMGLGALGLPSAKGLISELVALVMRARTKGVIPADVRIICMIDVDGGAGAEGMAKTAADLANALSRPIYRREAPWAIRGGEVVSYAPKDSREWLGLMLDHPEQEPADVRYALGLQFADRAFHGSDDSGGYRDWNHYVTHPADTVSPPVQEAVAVPNQIANEPDAPLASPSSDTGIAPPPLPSPAPPHLLASAASAARVIRSAIHPAPEVIAKADGWASAHSAGPGVYLDRTPPADPAAVVRETLARTRVVKSLTVLQSGRDCEDVAQEISPGGPKAAAYPIRTAESCKNLDAVHRAEKLGLAPTAAVCPDCPHNIMRSLAIGLTPAEIVAGGDALPWLLEGHSDDDFDDLPWHSPPRPTVDPEPLPPSRPTTTEDVMLRQCPHLLALDAVKIAQHRVATSTRTAFNFDDVTADAEIVILLDNAEDVVAPHAITGSIRTGDLVRLGRAATEAARKCRRNRQPAEWWDALRDTTDAIRAALAERVRATIPRTPAVPAPKLWPATLWAVWGAQRGTEGRMPDQLIRVCAAAASGELRTLVFTPGDPVAGDPNGWVSATWCPRVPPDATVIALADAPADALGRAVGRSVIDITSGGPPSWTAHAVQCPTRVTGGSRESGIAARIRGHLAAHHGARLAVLLPGNQKHFDALRAAVENLLVPAERKRVEFAGWYDRGVPACDRVLALGVPAIPPQSVRRRLEQRDLIAAALADKDWGEVRWHGTRTDGTELEVVGQGYRHPVWEVAYRDAVLGLLRRKFVRVTVPITVVADLDLGLPLVDEDFAIDGDDLRLLEALRDAARTTGPVSVISARSKRKSKKKGFLAEMTVSRTDRLAEAAGLSESTAKRRLNALAGAGLVVRVGARGGWTWPGRVVYPDYEPGEGADAWDTSTPDASGESASLDRLVPECKVAVSDPVPAEVPVPVPAASLVTEPAEPEATVEPETTAEARWDPELCSLACWFAVAEERLPRAPFRLPRPGRPGGFVIADDPPALYSKLWALISAGPGAANADGLARNLRELYAVFGPRPETQPTAGPPAGAAA